MQVKDCQKANEIISFHLEDGILHGTYLVQKINLGAAINATSFKKEITMGKPYPALADISRVKDMSKEARAFFSQDAGEDLLALAVIVNNPVTRMLTNFFLQFNKPVYPFRIFTDRKEAICWLKKYQH
ncbi:MAG: hypothetical protein ACLFUB_07005 [Cyclobacteriaceae bacterium]